MSPDLLFDALNLTNGPTDDWDNNLESFSSARDFCPSYGLCCLLSLDTGYLGFDWC